MGQVHCCSANDNVPEQNRPVDTKPSHKEEFNLLLSRQSSEKSENSSFESLYS